MLKTKRKKLFYSDKAIFAGLAVIALFYCLAVFKNWSYWGINDWDQFTFWAAAARKAVVFYRQFPLWNPYGGGGSVLLAHPHSMFLSPFFAPVFLLGAVPGMKLMIPLHLFAGLAGMYLLCRAAHLNKPSALAGSFIFMLSSAFGLHIAEGHYSYLVMAFMPWLFLFYIKAKERIKFTWAAGAVLTLMLFSGSVDILAMSIVILALYTLFISLKHRDFRYAKVAAWTFFTFAALSAVKLLPLLEFVRQNPRLVEESSQAMNLKLLLKIFLSRSQAENMNNLFIKGVGWHEYGCYVGLMPVMFFFIGFTAKLKEKWVYVLMVFTALLIMFGNSSVVNLWGLLKKAPFYSSLTCPSRYVIAVLFFFSILSAAGFGYLQAVFKKYFSPKLAYFFTAAVLGFIVVDLFAVNAPILKKAFVVSALEIKKAGQPFKQEFMKCKNPLQYSCMYENFLNNTGTIDSYEVLHLKQGEVLPYTSNSYKGEVYLAEGRGRVLLESFSPNEVKIKASLSTGSRVVINQNFSKGWLVFVNKKLKMQPEPYKGLLSVKLEQGEYSLKFVYRPFSFLAGIFISLLGVIFIIFLWIKPKKPELKK